MLLYQKKGIGAKKILCFYGFGQKIQHFDFLVQKYAQDYTFYIVDVENLQKAWLVEAGQAKHRDFETYWRACLEAFWEENGADSQWYILGFSIGARLALLTYVLFPHKVKHLILSAPDGLYKQRLFEWLTQSWLGKRIWYITLFQIPNFLQLLLKTSAYLGLISTNLVRFVLRQIDTPTKRQLLYDTWRFYAQVPSVAVAFHSLSQHYATPTDLFLSTEDKIIAYTKLCSIAQKIPQIDLHNLKGEHTYTFYQIFLP